ncbi:MAG: lipid-A-disaccharide synthase [Bacteriovoracaceae bacterium]|jgi:lipid-A-disaccharide synthase|nr:lipid-A-disaccharide synthase [Halobacteriovoraceae bacterium]MDP7320215.1 lipid-A-disaccharide synthase [Bacteriovoracaceae bacterium]
MSALESCLVIAGEKSGEDHAMTFFPELKKRVPNCDFYGVGGDRLEAQGLSLRYHLKDFSGIGISEVLSKIPFYYKALDVLLAEVKERKTKTAILIDFQGFNLKLAKKLKKLDVKVLYYVAPQAWVWKPWRAKVLEKNVHTLFTILPFEKKWFQERGVSKVRSVLHPLMLEYKEKLLNIRERKSSDFATRKKRILILPGSRNTEVGTLLDIFMRATKLIEEDYEIELGIVKSESVNEECYKEYKFDYEWNSSKLAEALNWADMSIAASGTVTLATGLFQLPTVVCYKVSLFTEFVLAMLIPYKGPASLTNIIHKQYVFPEFIQVEADRYNIAKTIKSWIQNPQEYDRIISILKETKGHLTGDEFSVAEYMADVINHDSQKN